MGSVNICRRGRQRLPLRERVDRPARPGGDRIPTHRGVPPIRRRPSRMEETRVPREDDRDKRSNLVGVERSPVLDDPGNVDSWQSRTRVARLALPEMEPHGQIVTRTWRHTSRTGGHFHMLSDIRMLNVDAVTGSLKLSPQAPSQPRGVWHRAEVGA